jgi:hypothetical protein
VDLLLAMDFAIRRFHLWQMEGALTPEQYRAILQACTRRRETLAQAAGTGVPVPDDTGLPSRLTCWQCLRQVPPAAQRCGACGAALDTPAVRLIRYRSFLCREVKRLEEAGRLPPGRLDGQLAETAWFQVEALQDLQKPAGH